MFAHWAQVPDAEGPDSVTAGVGARLGVKPGRTGRHQREQVMRILHISVTDKGNGAHLAGFRLHQGLCRLGIQSSMFVKHRLDDSGDDTIKEYQRWPGSLFWRVKTRAYRYWISRERTGNEKRLAGHPFIYDRAFEGRRAISQMPMVDIVYIHAIYDFIDYVHDLPLLASRAPIVFFLHDKSYFTGGCPHDCGCGRFVDRCGACPLLLSKHEGDLSRRIWERKHVVFSKLRDRLHFVAPSCWIANEAHRSSLLRDFPVTVIANCVDTEVFRPNNRLAMRRFFGIPQAARVVGFLSHPLGRVSKGLPLLAKALERSKNEGDLFLLTGGGGKPPADIGIPHLHLGRIHDDWSLSAFYSAVDLVSVPSLNDNLPSVVMEAMACGKAVVGFSTGGIPEMVRHGETGLLCPTGDAEALGRAISDLLKDPWLCERMGETGRKIAVKEYSVASLAQRHADLCAGILLSRSDSEPIKSLSVNTY